MRLRVLLALLVLPAFALALFVGNGSMSDPGRTITQQQFGDDWPLTTSEGILRCEMEREITFQRDGTTYTVNGTAEHGAYGDITPIRAKAPNGTPMDLAPLVEHGLRLCG